MKTQIQTRIGLTLALTLALLAGLAPRAEAAGYQMPITFGGYTNRSEALTNFPVLVVFSNGVGSSGFNWTNQSFLSPNGYDLRFRDAADTMDLNYEIESWFTSIAAATNLPGCILWLKADQGVQTSGSTVTNWLDQSGNGNNGSTVGGNPQLVANGITGDDPAVRFDGVGDYVQTALNVPLTCTIVTVFKQTSTSPSVGPVWQTDIGQSLSGFFPLWSDGKQYLGVNGSPMLNQASTFALNSSYITEVAYDNATPSTKLYSNGSLNQSGSSVPQSSSSFRLGYRSSSDYWVGDIAEVIIYNRVLTSYELIQVNDYLSRKYGIAVATVPAACIWVQVPTIPTNGTGSILAKWGDAANSSQLPCTTNGAVWTNGFVGVWHLNQTTGTTVPDSSSNRYDGTLAGGGATWVSGTIANGLQLDGTGTGYFSLPDISGRFGNNAGTLTMLLKSTTEAGFVTLGSADANSWYPWSGNHTAYMSVFRASGANRVNSFALSSVDRSKWHQVAITSETGGSTKWRFFQNAGLIQEVAATATIGVPTVCYIGKSIQPTDSAIYLTGALDEVRIANVARSTNWVWAEYATMASNTLFSTYGAVSNTAVSTTYKLKMAFTNYTAAEVLTNFPVLVTFSNGLYGTFNYNTFTAPASGGDLRFMDSTETTYLDFEIEKWATNGASYAWVRVPQLSSNTTIYAKWGGSDTNLPACTTNGAVWESNFKGVWHFPNGGTFTAQDSTTNSKHGTPTNMTAGVGPIGGAGSFNGSNTTATGSYVQTPVVSTANNSVTLSAWINTANGNQDGQGILYNGSDKDGNGYGMFVNKESVTSGNLYILYGGIKWWDTGKGITQNAWHHIAITLSADGTTTTAYVDGLSVGTYNAFGGANGGAPWTPTLETDIGRDNFIATYHRSFYGLIDEPRVANTIRSANWVWAEYANVASNAFFNGYGTVIAPVVVTTPPQIQNQAPTGVMTNGATFNGKLVTNGFENAAVYVAWGQTNGAVSGAWATTNWWNPGDWTNGSYPSTNMTLAANANYYYRFGATNSTTNVLATLPQSYQYLITGEVTVQPTDPTGRVTLADTAEFTVYRPASCTNEALTVSYTLGGTATNGTHYTNSPAATLTNGTVTLAAGQTNAVVTVWPLNVAAPLQTVVLSLASGPYAIGAANSATCTLVAVSGVVYDDVAAGFWTNPATWSPSTGCPTNAGDSATVNSVVVSASASALVPKIQLIDIARTASTTGTLYFTDNTVQTPNLQLNGGMLKQSGSGGSVLSNGVVTVRSNSQWYVVGSDNHMTWWQGAVNYDEIRDWVQGGVTNAGLLTLDGSEIAKMYHYGAGTNFTGGWLIKTGPGAATENYGRGALNLYTDGGLGSGTCTVQSVLNVYAGQSGSPGRPKPARVIVQPAWPDCGVYLDPGNPVSFSQGGLSITNWDFDLYGGYLAFGDRDSTYAGGTVTVYSNAVFYGKRDNRWTATSTYNGEIRGTKSITFNTSGADFTGQAFYLGGNNTNFSGGVILLRNRLYVTHPNALGTGPVMLRPADADGSLYLDATPNADWALSNTIAGTKSIVVEDGASYRLTSAGGTISPGTNTAAVAVLTVNGKFAFAKSGGGTPATLTIDVASVGTVAGANFDQLLVTTGDVALASSITNCALVVNLGPSPVALNGMTLTILAATNANFAPYQFASVTGLGSGGSVVYSNGYVALTWVAQTPIINNGSYANLAATSCDVSGYLSSTGDTPTEVRCYWGTNSMGTNGWGYTNFLGTQSVGTVTTSLTNLTGGLTYYYRFYATNGVGEYWSMATSNFTTLADVTWNDATNGNWAADNANTWNAGSNVYPHFPLNDTVIVDSHTVTVAGAQPAVKATWVTRTAATTGTLYYSDGSVQTPNLDLAGGMLKQSGYPAASVLSNGVVTVRSNSQWYVVGFANHVASWQGAFNYDEIRDWVQGGVTNTGLLTLDGSETAKMYHYGAGTNFTGGWLIKTGPGGATEGYGRGALSLYTDGGLGSGTCTVQTVLNVYAGQSALPARPKPARVVVQPTWPDCGVYLDPGNPLSQGGLSITNWDFDLYGGYLAFGDRASTYAGGTVTLYSNAVFYGKRDSRWAATSTYNGEIRGTKSITFNTSGADFTGQAFYLGGNNTNFSGGVILLRNRLYVTHPNALGTGPVMLRPADADGSLYLDATPNADWALSNTIAGTSSIVVEDGAGTNTLTVLGTLDPGTNGVSITTNSTGILRVDGNMAFGAGSRLKIDIAGTNGVAGVDFDRLVVDHNLTGLGNATLEVAVNGSLTTEMLNGLSFVVVSNATALASTFGSVVSWPGKVVYNQPTGTVKLTGSDLGSVYKFR